MGCRNCECDDCLKARGKCVECHRKDKRIAELEKLLAAANNNKRLFDHWQPQQPFWLKTGTATGPTWKIPPEGTQITC